MAYMSLFQWLLKQSERSNWITTRKEPADKISVRSNGGRNRSSNLKIPVLKRNAEKCCCRVRWISLCSNTFCKIRTVRLKLHTVWTCWQSFSQIQRWTNRRRWSEVSDETFSFSLLHYHSLFHSLWMAYCWLSPRVSGWLSLLHLDCTHSYIERMKSKRDLP